MSDPPFRLKVEVQGAGVVTFDKKTLRAALRQAGNEVAGLARSMVRQSSGGGRFYSVRRHGALHGHYASAPGQPPASLSGALAASIRVKPFRNGDGVSVRDAQFYAKFLEAGAHGGGPGRRNKVSRRGGQRTIHPSGQRVLAPRPFLSAALDRLRSSIDARLKAAVLKGVEFKKVAP